MSPPNPSAPPNPAVPPLNPSGGGPPDGAWQPLLAGKGILNVDGVLRHGPDLFPKKPFDEVLNLKTVPSSSSGYGGIRAPLLQARLSALPREGRPIVVA
jgi:hypothetical protein